MPIALASLRSAPNANQDMNKCSLYGTSVPCARVSPPDVFNDKLFISKYDIPVLDEHDDNFRGNISEELLRLICENTNNRIGHDNYVLILIGHTDPDLPEEQYPEIVGYISKFKIGVYENRPCILADMHFKRARFDYAMSFPYRSVERVFPRNGIVAPERNYIDFVCLLRRKPARSLGLVTYSEKKDSELVGRAHYSRDFESVNKDKSMALDPEDIQAIVAGVTGGILAAFEKMAEVEGEAEPFAGEETPAEETLEGLEGLEGEEMAAEEPAPVEGEGEEMPEEEPEEEEAEYEGAGAPAVPGGNNTFVQAPMKKDEEREKMARNEQEITVARYERELKAERDGRTALEKRIAELESTNRRVNYARDLEHMKNLGYQFDSDHEIERLMKLSPESATERLEDIKKYYRRDPIGQGLIETEKPERQESEEEEVPESDEVARYAEEVGMYQPSNKMDPSQIAIESVRGAVAERRKTRANGKKS